jgi:hypothetical protein
MRALAYFAGWLLAAPGLLLAAAMLAVHRAIALASLYAILWESLIAFAYGVPFVVLLVLIVGILGFFRMGRVVGAGMLLIASLGALAIVLEATGAPKDSGEALFLAPTAAAAVLAGWLLHAETRDAPVTPGTVAGG